MAIFNYQNIGRWHYYVSLFFLPLIIFYVLTAVVAVFNVFPLKILLKETIALHWNDSEQLKKAEINKFLKKNNLKVPKGEFKNYHQTIVWGNLTTYHLRVEYQKNNAVISIKQPSFMQSLLALHKNQGGKILKYFVLAFCLIYFLVYFLGLLIIIKNKKYQKLAFISFLSGLFVSTCFFVLA